VRAVGGVQPDDHPHDRDRHQHQAVDPQGHRLLVIAAEHARAEGQQAQRQQEHDVQPDQAAVGAADQREQPADRAPDWLHHPTLTGMDTRALADLLAAVEQDLLDHPPISLHHQRARHPILRRGPLSLSDRLLVTVLRHRWKTQIRALTCLLGSPANAVGDAVHEMPPILEALDRRIRQAPITAADLANLIGRTHTKKGK
jgi:hypothetical protein